MASKNDALEVTDQNFGDLLIQGLQEAVAVRRGEREPAARVRRPMTAREAIVQPPRQYQGPETQRIREQLGLSQSVFARVLNASAETVKAWEQGKRQPDGMALTLLEIAETHPEALMSRVRLRGGTAASGPAGR
ncbi:MAG TPA: helix-turn-helix domain-containing protein [Longimicrobium sp.]|nr:helix-turn-helix domain-containing protein [Longimicrobium sp.]